MTQKANTYHIPVLKDACIQGLNIQAQGIYVDVTFGGGGHSKAIYKNLNEKGFLYGLDQDADAKENIWSASNFEFIQSNFSFLTNQLRARKVNTVDGILADLGVSSHQFDVPERGFSTRGMADLDMRMNKTGSTTAADVINQYDENDLIGILRKYGEIKNARKLASEIVQKRLNAPIQTTQDFIELLSKMAPKFKEHKYYAQVFQALRIEVNRELEVLESFLVQASELLNPGGRLVVISYHSLEDRIVKNFMKKGNFEGVMKKDFYGNPIKPLTEINRKPITPEESELAQNTRSRSAKLRIAEKNE
jgi:16S rRNA (cytosine1402-N4)-methyltransferase